LKKDSDPTSTKSASKSTIIEAPETSLAILSNIIQKNAIAIKRKHQAQSHEQMKCWRQDNIEEMGISSGAVVTVQVDSRDISHPQGLIDVVAYAKTTGGVLVICASGSLLNKCKERILGTSGQIQSSCKGTQGMWSATELFDNKKMCTGRATSNKYLRQNIHSKSSPACSWS
jgi:hypothetical protein